MTVDEAQGKIMDYAAMIANHDPYILSNYSSPNVFYHNRDHSRRGGLVLSIDPMFTTGASDDQVGNLHRIGRAAIKRSIIIHEELFVGIILSTARNGVNYFDRFEKRI